METFIREIKDIVSEDGVEATALDVRLAIELFEEIRHYPSSYTEEKKLADMRANMAKIAKAVIEIDSKKGMENQLEHSENGYSRRFKSGILAYGNVTGFAHLY